VDTTTISRRKHAQIQPQRLPHRPGLEGAAARRVGRVAVRDLRNVPEARRVEVGQQRREKARSSLSLGRDRATPAAYPRLDERAEEPGPDRALVIRRVAFTHAALVTPDVARLAGRERAQPDRRPEPRLHRGDHLPRRRAVEQREWKSANGEDLI